MKLIQNKKGQPKPIVAGNTPEDRARMNLVTELYRVTVAVDELKALGTVDELDAAQKMLWGVLLVLDGMLRRK